MAELEAHINRDWKIAHRIWENIKKCVPRLLDTNTTEAAVENSTDETSVYSLSIGPVGSKEAVRVRLYGTFKNNRGGTATLVLRIKLGSTTIYADTSVAFPDSAVICAFVLDFVLTNKDSQSSQALVGHVVFANTNAATTGYGDLSGAAAPATQAPIYGTAAENLALAKVLDVTAQLQYANANLWIKRHFASVELLPEV